MSDSVLKFVELKNCKCFDTLTFPLEMKQYFERIIKTSLGVSISD